MKTIPLLVLAIGSLLTSNVHADLYSIRDLDTDFVSSQNLDLNGAASDDDLIDKKSPHITAEVRSEGRFHGRFDENALIHFSYCQGSECKDLGHQYFYRLACLRGKRFQSRFWGGATGFGAGLIATAGGPGFIFGAAAGYAGVAVAQGPLVSEDFFSGRTILVSDSIPETGQKLEKIISQCDGE